MCFGDFQMIFFCFYTAPHIFGSGFVYVYLMAPVAKIELQR